MELVVRVNVAGCDIDPAVAVTVTEDVCFELPDPQAANPIKPAASPTKTRMITRGLSGVRRPKMVRSKRLAKPPPANETRRPLPPPITSRSSMAVLVVPIVIVVVATAPVGVTVCGLNVQEYPEGNPAQEKDTAALKPPVGVIVRVVMAAVVEVALPLAGFMAIEKSAATADTVTVIAVEVDPAYVESPAY